MHHGWRSMLSVLMVGLLLALGWMPASVHAQVRDEDTETETETTTETETDTETGAEAETETGVDDNTYTSPTWGYTLEWDEDIWAPNDDDELIDEEDGLDRLVLESEDGILYVEGVERYDGAVADCLEGETGLFSEDPDVEDFEPLEDEDGDPIADEEDDRAFAAFSFTLAVDEDEDPLDLASYIECRVLVEEKAVLILTLGSTIDGFEDVFADAEEIFDTIEIEGATDTETETETDDRSVTDDELLNAVTFYEDIPLPPDYGTHVEGTVDYEQDPPAGGDHAAVWQNCGFYDEPVINEQAVHSLEHGAVWITYDPDLPQEDIDALEEMAEDQTHLLISPFEGLPSPIVATAWAVQLEIEGVDDPYLPAFIDFFQEGPQNPEPGAPCNEGGSSETAS